MSGSLVRLCVQTRRLGLNRLFATTRHRCRYNRASCNGKQSNGSDDSPDRPHEVNIMPIRSKVKLKQFWGCGKRAEALSQSHRPVQLVDGGKAPVYDRLKHGAVSDSHLGDASVHDASVLKNDF